MLRAVSAAARAACSDPASASASASARRRRHVFKLGRIQQQQLSASISVSASASASGTTPPAQTVLSNERVCRAPSPAGGSRGAPAPTPTPPPAPPRRSWTVAAAALALTASLGGVYFYRKMSDEEKEKRPSDEGGAGETGERGEVPAVAYPSDGVAFPRHVQYLLVGGGTASFAAMRAIRSARPDAAVLIVGDEPHPPYMRPPLSKELWREPDIATLTDDALAALSFRQWNGKRRPLAYEPLAFYTPVERLAERGGAGVARGWTVVRLDPVRHEAELRAPGTHSVTLTYEKCLLAPGARPRRLPELAEARDAGRVLAVRGARDAARLARALHEPAVRRVALVGGGFLATELSAALADRLGPGRVLQLYREEAPLARVLPAYLARDAARRLRAAGVELLSAEVESAAPVGAGVELRLRGGGALTVDLVVECAGVEPAEEVARAAGLETHAALGGVVVNAELQARTDLWVAGDAACFYDETLGRRRVEHHDHAVVSGRLAGENMAAAAPPKTYSHQSMFWSDLGPSLGYEAIGLVDASLPTVGVFSAEAVHLAAAEMETQAATAAPGPAGTAPADPGAGTAPAAPGEGEGEGERRYERGVVFYTREKRVVGVLLWNLFNRMHVARQVLAQGEFDDLFEVAKLFALHEED